MNHARRKSAMLLAAICLLDFGGQYTFNALVAAEKALSAECIPIADLLFSFAWQLFASLAVLVFFWRPLTTFNPEKLSLVFTGLMTLGAVSFCFIGNSKAYLISGQLLFGCGLAPIFVTQNTLLARHFERREVAFGVALVSDIVATMLSFNISFYLANQHTLEVALGLAALLALMSFLVNFTLARGLGSSAADAAPGPGSESGHAQGDRRLDGRFILAAAALGSFYAAWVVFKSVSTYAFRVWGEVLGSPFLCSPASLTSLLDTATLLFGIPLGYFMRRAGMRTHIVTVGCLVTGAGMLAVGLKAMHPIAAVTLISVGILGARMPIWPIIAELSKAREARAYYIVSLIQYSAMGAACLLAGALYRDAADGKIVICILAALAFGAAAMSLALTRADRRLNGHLDAGIATR